MPLEAYRPCSFLYTIASGDLARRERRLSGRLICQKRMVAPIVA
ncbi:hypothetical protein PORCRE_569 [Porphyromonas crevioricanis JCM 15906]|uniref:Uncharacterized protein n=2 Tax=Porphyromonas crevioricanis TaxID=393921 RepID=A0A2X4PK64_9PORP|nr:hypothetical protein PORCRE_569 [Porphyromonas crevioricanis JCM 15906]GAD07444.1 hypothetical protein PORCAN_1065 [Porphyromonas crevioricanis JCM 13913]SJZ95621.1 hypothetical protein SAMN02745203_01387 [Porphyromonas crevioricanis]SQH72685.1 Uncharacterised protein [Porphyromonas crevioricanis]